MSLVAAVAVSAVPVERLSSSSAPLSLVFREVAGVSPATISAIAIVATLNTILAQMTMAARVVYGLAREGELPAIFARVHRRTGTPLVATACIAALVVPLALFVPLTPLAEATSLVTLAVFALVNLALAAAELPRCAVRQPARHRSDMDTCNRACHLPRHDGGRLIQVSGRPDLVWMLVSAERLPHAIFDVSAAGDAHHRNIEGDQSHREISDHLVHLVDPGGAPQRMCQQHQD